MAVVDRIGSTTPVDTVNVGRRVQEAGSGESADFRPLLDESEGVIYEPGGPPEPEAKTIAQVREEIAREEAAAARANLHTRFDGPGVAVELSTDGVEASAAPAKEQTIGAIFKDAWNAIVGFFLSIWNGGGEKSAEAAGTAAEAAHAASVDEAAGTATATAQAEATAPATAQAETATATEQTGSAPTTASAPTEAAPTRSTTARTRTDTPEDIAAFLVDYGGRHLAKNSDLLTQYDRSGHIVSMDASDRRRILQGEGKVRRF
ncbi:hypothetical protein SAMN02910292_00926 [Lachnospiraceae bacterium XBB2008]|nr:hypothetical protein SAMN02910292_00926 [Lachnospiraceae bacterium XBB2008]